MRKRLLVKKYIVDSVIRDHQGCDCWDYKIFYVREEAEDYLKRLQDLGIRAYLRETTEELEFDVVKETIIETIENYIKEES